MSNDLGGGTRFTEKQIRKRYGS